MANKKYKPITDKEYLDRASDKLLTISQELKPLVPESYYKKFIKLIDEKKFSVVSSVLQILIEKGPCDRKCRRALVAEKMIETSRAAQLTQNVIMNEKPEKQKQLRPKGPREKSPPEYITTTQKRGSEYIPRYECDVGQIINPKSGRCVNSAGRIGQKIK